MSDRRLLLVAVLATAAACAVRQDGHGRGGSASAGAEVLAFTAPESAERLARSRYKVDFFHLASHFEGQTNKAFCGPTAATIVLNALRADNPRIEKPQDPSLLPPELKGVSLRFDPLFHRYTQQDLFNPTTNQVKTRAEIMGQPRTPGATPDAGMQLRQLDAFLRAFGVASEVRVADDRLSDDAIRRELMTNLATADDYTIVNYTRAAVGQEGGGHISPLGAYDEASDSFLVLDVNPNGHTWAWITTAALCRAMRTRDRNENRGYLLIREGPP